ncbi:Acetyl-CoA carboxylase 1 [Camellia lanceoleosa]|uniref:Acetyl-CoA carboxylase 1 n=1 Tax=Camellia lanceoleosa TaxID=1840588 RepID=A0ACC0FZ03_9ERIC|nr:Acetyl-CoA carboxylase 1 [Camellia lanceoleosa]
MDLPLYERMPVPIHQEFIHLLSGPLTSNINKNPQKWSIAYFSVKSGEGIHEFSDSQFGHIFAFGESRALAIANMVLGLKEIQIQGEIRTNVDYTIDLLHASDYKDNKIHTGWLDSRIAMRIRAERPPWYLYVVGGALYKASTSSAAMVSEYVGYLEKGQIPPKGSFVIKVKGPEGWSWDPDQVPVVVDQAGCNANEDINFRFTEFTVSGKVVGSVGGESCSNKNGGPSNVNVELLSPTSDLVTSVLTSPTGSYSFTNIIPGKYKLRASRLDFNVEVRGSAEVELGFENGLVDDIFFVPGYDICGFVVAQAAPIFDML